MNISTVTVIPSVKNDSLMEECQLCHDLHFCFQNGACVFAFQLFLLLFFTRMYRYDNCAPTYLSADDATAVICWTDYRSIFF